MSHRFAMVFSIALTLLLAGGVYASRDRLLATSESGAQPVSVVDQSAGASTTDNSTVTERVPPVRRSLDLPEQQPSFASEISAGDDEDDNAEEDDRDSESVNNDDDDDHDSGEHDDDDDDLESDDDD